MRNQNVVLGLAAVVTGAFLLTVGLVLAWPLLTPAVREVPQIALNIQQDIFAPMPIFENQREEPIARDQLPNVRGAAVPTQDYAFSRPHTHGNLTIFLIEGPDTLKDANVMTLQEAIEQNVAVVHETGAGNLLIDNRGNAPLFIQAGDIVKGGTQDRTLPSDMLVPANTERMPIAALCVEQGRSFPRGDEVSTSFQVSSEQLPGRQLKLSAYRRMQNDVWRDVQTLQTNLARNTGGEVKGPQSPTSLQLCLEHERVRNAVGDAMISLATAIEGKNNVIGYAVAVNGQIQSVDVYASSALFQKLWPKLIRASAVDALAQRHEGGAFNAPTEDAVRAFLTSAQTGQAVRVANGRTNVIRQDTGRELLFDTCDPNQQNLVLHRAFLAK